MNILMILGFSIFIGSLLFFLALILSIPTPPMSDDEKMGWMIITPIIVGALIMFLGLMLT